MTGNVIINYLCGKHYYIINRFYMTNLRKIISISFFSIQMVNHSLNAQQQEKGNEDIDRDTVYRLEEVVVSGRQILGSKFKARNRTGSAYYISPEEIRKFGYTDINRMLKAVPGVNMYEEDGFGLRPNISLRGTKAERSERISSKHSASCVFFSPLFLPTFVASL